MLTEIACRNTKPSEKLVKLSDGEGLQMWIMPDGAKYWRLAYRFEGKQKILALGVYPAVSLREARLARHQAKKLLAAGTDPSQQRKVEQIAERTAVQDTFAGMANEFLAKKRREDKAATTMKKLEWLLAKALPFLGSRPVADITPVEVLEVLRRVEARGQLETATRLRSVLSEVFRYAIAHGKASSDPTQSLKGAIAAPVTKSRPAIVEPLPFGKLLRDIVAYEGSPEVVIALQLMALTFPRPGELRNAMWSEFDLEAGVWIIPPGRMKMRRQHRIPLAPQAVALLKRLHAMTGHGELLFPSVRSPQKCISENTLNAALRNLGYASDVMCAHGFRSAASSMLNESSQWNPDAIEAQLAHVESNSVRRAYARAEYWDERVRMMAWWADRIDAMRRGAEVVQLRA
jgi:integrase